MKQMMIEKEEGITLKIKTKDEAKREAEVKMWKTIILVSLTFVFIMFLCLKTHGSQKNSGSLIWKISIDFF